MSPGPRKRSAAGRCHQARSRFYAGWRLRLTRPTFVRPAVNLFTIVAETAGADGLKIAETFPEGRGSLQARQAQRRRAVRFRARGGAGWRHKCLIRPTGSHHLGPPAPCANAALTWLTPALPWPPSPRASRDEAARAAGSPRRWPCQSRPA
ncbi:hypothetical protein B6I60_11145 [Klebsiella pneumoniae]|nr:hypothetical protein B6I60_11145 [Klebsiella pneumoniae]